MPLSPKNRLALEITKSLGVILILGDTDDVSHCLHTIEHEIRVFRVNTKPQHVIDTSDVDDDEL